MSITDRSPRGNIASPPSGIIVDLGSVFYNNPRLPAAYTGNAQNALNYIIAAMYPDYKGTVPNHASLPPTGNSPNDYIIVTDDGAGTSAGYVWVVQDNLGSWSKKFDATWSYEGIYAETVNRTSYMYVSKNGYTERDATGNPITGLYAGQRIYGGDQAGQNLTLSANSGDTAGGHTGFVQVDDNFQPAVGGTYSLGAAGFFKFKDLYLSGVANIGTMTAGSGSILDTSGAITFGSSNLSTTGTLLAGQITGTSFVTGTLTITGGSFADTSGAISFGAANLSTTGNLRAGSGSVLADVSFGAGSITSLTPTISFGSNGLVTTGNISGGTITGTQVNGGNVRLSGNTVSATSVNGNLALLANGSGVVDVQSAMTTLSQTVTGVLSVSGQFNAGNLRIATNTVSSINLNGNITVSPNGSGIVEVTSTLRPSITGVYDLGQASLLFQNLYLSGGISDGTTSISQSVLQSFRAANVGVAVGMGLFWDGTKWTPVTPNAEVDHRAITHLNDPGSDAGHTQFAMLQGRAGGQIIQGGTAASEHLTLESTSNATKGRIKAKDSLVSFTAPIYSAGWTGTDLGFSGFEFRNLYTKGELVGARLENVLSTALPSASGQNVGRTVWATDVNKIYVDVGGSWQVAGSGKYISDTSWNGTQTTQTFTVSSKITDARNAIWVLYDNTNNFEQIYCTINKISATQVQVNVTPALTSGSYRLIGLE